CLRCWVHLRIRPVPYTTLFRSWVGREASCPHPRLLPRHLARVRHPDREGGPHVLRDAEERPRGFLGAEGRCLAAVDLQQPGPHLPVTGAAAGEAEELHHLGAEETLPG